MAKSLNTLALESIDFQDGMFYKELTLAIEELRKNTEDKKQKGDSFFQTDSIKLIIETIRDYTNLKIEISEGAPAIYTPVLALNHILSNQDRLKELQDNGVDMTTSSEHLMRILKTKALQGSVNLKKGKVSGCFEKYVFGMEMPQYFLTENFMTAEECAAIMLHEIGHVFTFIEFSNRTMTTNQTIAGLTRILDKNISNANREIIYTKASKALELDAVKTEALKKCRTEEQLSVVIVDAEIEKCKSELGFSIYDVTSCEYLADQFCARQGAGRALVTGLDKIFKLPNPSTLVDDTMSFFKIIAASFMTLGLYLPFWAASVIFGPDKNNDTYDNPAARMNRIKLQNMELIKNPNLSPEVKKVILAEIKMIERCASDYKDRLSSLELVAYYLRPGYRNAHKYELLQKDLEKLSSSDLFSAAAKLKMV